MAASINDLITQATVNSRPVPTTVSSPRTAGVTTLQCLALTGWATGSAIHFVTYKINTAGLKVAGSQCDWKGIVSGTTVTGIVLKAGTDVGNAVGDIVEAAPTAAYANDVYSFATQDHDTQGRHKDLHGSNGLTVHGLTDTASAVNNLRSTNSITATDPILSAEGGDTNVGQIFQPKGLGNSRVKGRADGWNDLSGFGTFTYNVNNGQKEYVITTPSDLSSFLSVGQRMRFDRSVAPPTQAMAFTAASSQYGTKASPTGITDTSTFTTEAWVFLNSYSASDMGIISRDSGGASGGWGMLATANAGQVSVFWRNAAGTTQITTRQSLPLKRWVHVACVVTNIGVPAATIYINGNSTTSTVSSSAATTRLQSGSLQVGAYNSISFFDGYVSEARYWSTNQSQANIQANMSISLTGSETNLVALFQGNGNFTDKTSNANSLTATNGAIATQASNPYNTTEYGIIHKVTSTQVTVFCGTDYNIPNAALTNPYYSTVKNPAGWPASKYKWMVDYKYKTQTSQVVTSISAWLNHTGFQFSIPTGDFDTQSLLPASITATSVAFLGARFTLSTANNTQSNDELTGTLGDVQIANTEIDAPVKIEGPISNTALTTWFLNDQPVAVNGTTTVFITGTQQPAMFRFFSAYI